MSGGPLSLMDKPMDEVRRGRWMNAAALVVALLAALSLAVTVGVARAELAAASQALVRGEGESLAARLHESGRRRHAPPSRRFLERQLDELRPLGLRSIAITSPHGSVLVGEAQLSPAGPMSPGQLIVREQRARLVTRLPPPQRGDHPDPDWDRDGGGDWERNFDRDRPPPEVVPGTRAGDGAPLASLAVPGAEGPLLTLEYEPWVLARGSAGMDRTVAVASLAVLVLLAFAGALSARIVGRARLEKQAEHARRLAALGQMAGVLAHELRNPLASLKGHAQLLAESLEVGSRSHAKAELVVSEAVRLEGLTRDLLAFVRDGASNPQSIRPAELLGRALRDLPADRIVLDLSAAPPWLFVDEARLSVAIGNLVRNALQVASADGCVAIVVARDPAKDGVVLTVADDGPGIAESERERIFEPFFTTKIHGTGLGLAVARRAVEEHGGTLDVQGSSPRGSIFRIKLPAVAREQAIENETVGETI
jgi:two-component system, NtrC family, sensor histidine kinase HydH